MAEVSKKALTRAVRRVRTVVPSVIQALEERRLLTGVVSNTFSYAGIDQHIDVALSTAAASGLPASAFQLLHVTQNTAVPTQKTGVSTDGKTAIFKPTAGGALADGWYESYVRSSTLDADEYDSHFSFLNGDFNGDNAVNIVDFNILSVNFGQSGKTFAQGDANYDGAVNIVDFNVLAVRFGRSLPDFPTLDGNVVVGNTTDNALDLAWAANDTNPRDGFKVYRSGDAGVSYQLVATLADANASGWQDTGGGAATSGTTTTTAADTALSTGQMYWYRVRPYTTAAGAGASLGKAGGVVTHGTPVATGVTALGIGPGRTLVSWTPPSGPALVSGYRVYRSQQANFVPSTATLVTAVDQRKTQIVDSGLSRGHTYYYKIVAVGIDDSVSIPSLNVSANAQNAGPGISNGGTPFAATQDSDGDGTPDPLDTNNDNDTLPDEADSDDDNNGIPDAAEPDDRDTDGDGLPDGNPSGGALPLPPAGPGSWTVFNTHGDAHPDDQKDYLTEGYTEPYVNFSYSNAQTTPDSDPSDSIDDSRIEPRREFYGDHANDSQTFTLSNLPKHAVIQIGGTVHGSGYHTTDPNGTGTGVISVKANGVELNNAVPGPYSYFTFGDEFQSNGDPLTFKISGKSFGSGGGFYLQHLHITTIMPAVRVYAHRTAVTEDGVDLYSESTPTAPDYDITYTVERNGSSVGDLTAAIDWPTAPQGVDLTQFDIATAADLNGTTDGAVVIADGDWTTEFTLSFKDDDKIEKRELLVAQVKDAGNGEYLPPLAVPDRQTKTEIADNDFETKAMTVSFDSQGVKHDTGLQAAYSGPQWKDENGDKQADLHGDNVSTQTDGYPISYQRSDPTTTRSITASAGVVIRYKDPNVLNAGFGISGTGSGPGGGIFVGGLANVSWPTLQPDGSFKATVTSSTTSLTPLPTTIAHGQLSVDWSLDRTIWDPESQLGLKPPLSRITKEPGTSKNHIYVTGADAPDAFETVLDIGCRRGDGIKAGTFSEDLAVTNAIWEEFRGRSVNRVSGSQLRYWENDAATATDTATLLRDSNGQCGSWANLLLSCLSTQGVSRAGIIGVKSIYQNPLLVDPRGGMLVKNHTFVGNGTADPAIFGPFVYKSSEFSPAFGAPGQGNPNPPAVFLNHFIVRLADYDANGNWIDGEYLDPSYGGNVYRDVTETAAHAAWEDASIDGFSQAFIFPDGLGGFDIVFNGKKNAPGVGANGANLETLFVLFP